MEAGKVEAVIVAKLDRLTRSVKDLCELLESLRAARRRAVSVAESLDTGSAAGRLVITIMAAVSASGNGKPSANAPATLAAQAAKGERVGNIHYGYRLAADGEHVEPDPAEQAVLAEVRALRSRHRSLREIATALNESGYSTRRGSTGGTSMSKP